MRRTDQTKVSVLRAAALVALALLASMAMARPVHAAAQISTFTEGQPGTPFSLLPIDPALTTGDPLDQQLALITPITATMPFTVDAVSVPLSLGHPGMDKEFLSLAWTATVPRSTALIISYSVNGRAWLPAVGGGGFDLPISTHGFTIAYRITFITADPTVTPSVDDLGIEYTKWTGKPTNPGGSGDGTSHKPHPGPANKVGTGTYRFPTPAGGSSVAGASGTGTGTSFATGSGAGTGDSSGSPSSSATHTTSSARGSAGVPSPPMTTSAGPQQSVSGLAVDDQQAVVGTPFRATAAGTASGAGRPLGTAASWHSIPYAWIAAGVLALGVLLFTPWLVSAARLRQITSYDRRKARLFGPFGPLAP